MKRPVFLIFTNAMILIVLFCMLAQSLVLVQRIAVADKVKGRVEVRRGGRGEWQSLEAREPIKTGDVVRTGQGSEAEFVWAGGTRWKLMPHSQMTIKKATFNTVQQGTQSDLLLSSGKVFVRIMKKLNPMSSFQIETPTAVAAVRGTIFSVEVEQGKTQVAVWKGHVSVTGTQGEAETIEPGEAALAPAVGKLQTVRSAPMDAGFKQQKSIVLPQLDFQVQPLGDKRVLLRGQTEAGDKVTINGQPVATLGNGSFLTRLPLQPGANRFVVISTDKHGAQITMTKSLNATAALPSAPATVAGA